VEKGQEKKRRGGESIAQKKKGEGRKKFASPNRPGGRKRDTWGGGPWRSNGLWFMSLWKASALVRFRHPPTVRGQ